MIALPPPAAPAPRNWEHFLESLSDNQACRDYLVALRWGDGFVCPACGGRRCWVGSEGLRICRDCRHHVSITSGTIFAGTRMPLNVWFAAAWHFITRRRTPTATGMRRLLAINRYETAWEMLRSLRYATVAPDRPKLSGRVEVAPVRLTQASSRTIVIAVEVLPDGQLGSARLGVLPELSAQTVDTFVSWAVGASAELSILAPSEWTPHSPKLAGPRRVATQLARWIRPSAISGGRRHPGLYLEEFAFRFNSRSLSKGEQFQQLLHNGARVAAPPWGVPDRIAWPHEPFRGRE